MQIKNHAELKRALRDGHCFKILEHFFHADCTGQIREPGKIQTNGVYTHVKDEPENAVSKGNGGKGWWTDFGKASNWTFDGEICHRFDRNGKPIMDIVVL